MNLPKGDGKDRRRSFFERKQEDLLLQKKGCHFQEKAPGSLKVGESII